MSTLRLMELSPLPLLMGTAFLPIFAQLPKPSPESQMTDLVVLHRDPTKVEPMAIKDIKVVETYKEGRSIYRAD